MADGPLGASKRSGRSFPLASVLVFALVATACAEVVEDRPRLQNVPWFCASDAACPPDLACQFGICAASGEEEVTLRLRFVPPGGPSLAAPLELPATRVRLGTALPDTQLPALVQVRGRVAFEGSTPQGTSPVLSAEVRLRERNTGGDEGRLFVARTDRVSGRFSLAMPRGLYDVVVVPADEDVAPTRFVDVSIDDAPLDFIVPRAQRRRPFVGRVTWSTPDGEIHPLAGARVFATSLDRLHLSSASLTDADGMFRVFAPLEARVYRLEVRPSYEDAQPVPTITFEAIDLVDRDDTPQHFHAGTWGQPIELQGRVIDAGEAAWHITARAEALDPALYAPPPAAPDAIMPEVIGFRASGATRPDGTFTLPVFAGSYTVLAARLSAPPMASALPALRVEASSPGMQPVELMPQSRVDVRVRMSGSPAQTHPSRGRLRLEPVEVLGYPATAFGVQLSLLTREVLLEELASDTVALLPGRYRVELIPEERSGYAPVETAWEIPAGRAQVSRAITLAASGVVVGRVVGPSGNPLADVEITAWVETTPNQWVRALAFTNDAGLFRLLLPAPLP